MIFHRPTQWQLIPKGTNLLGHSVIPPRYGQVKEHKFQANIMKQKRVQCTYSNASKIRVTHTMIPELITSWSKTRCYFKIRPMGWMLLLLIDRTHLKKDRPSRDKLKSYGSRYSMFRTCGPRNIISLVIPRIGDNIH
jgi:hypothetical protein